MVTDPYRVLGISKDATEDEIKRAYRKKAKECHPDLHPDDPHAQEKMNEVNEAYDMLKNPEKYRQQTFNGYSNPYSQSGYQQYGQTYTYTNFNDFFNAFANGGQAFTIPMPNIEPNDSPEIIEVINMIRSQNYQYASSRLMNISSSYRNARWYYLYALCCYGMGYRDRAFESISRCVQMEPGRSDYRQVYDTLKQLQGSFYSQGFTNNGPFTYQKVYRPRHGIFYYFIMFQLLMWFLRIFFGGFGYYDTRNNSDYYNGSPAKEYQQTIRNQDYD